MKWIWKKRAARPWTEGAGAWEGRYANLVCGIEIQVLNKSHQKGGLMTCGQGRGGPVVYGPERTVL